jgi:cystathionine gamma-synthase
MHDQTKAIHTGVYQDQTFNSVTTPIYPSSTFRFDAVGQHRGYDYTRSGNPTRTALEQNIAGLEGGAGAVACGTGMGAITTAAMLLNAGDHLIAGNDIYGGTYRLFSQVLPSRGIEVSFINLRDHDAVRGAVQSNTKGLWIETPSNPLLNIIDIAAMVGIAKEAGAITMVDNTFLSPIFQRPFTLGVDVVVHSTTKYINGHSDVVGGAAIGRTKEMAERLLWIANAMGLTGSPFDAWLVLRGIKTLPHRMKAHQANATAIAHWLTDHPQVSKVYYTGLDSHPQRELIARQQLGHGGMLAFEIDAPPEALDRFFAALELFVLAESLGGVESLIEQPWTMSHTSMGEQGLGESGITPQTVRVSVGLEHPDDLIADLQKGLQAIADR